jgi:hypothetical protein
VLQILGGDLDIAAREAVDLVAEGALQHQRQFGAAMAVVGHRHAARNVEQPRRGIAVPVGRIACRTPPPTGAPAHRVQIAADIVAQGRRKRCRAAAPAAPDCALRRPGRMRAIVAAKAVVGHRGGPRIFQQRAADASKLSSRARHSSQSETCVATARLNASGSCPAL